jgi:hypothetical protein
MTQQAARKFSPIFVATITPASIEVKTSSKGDEYVLCAGAKFERNGHDAETRTVMAFGQSAQDVRQLLDEGKPVELAVQFNGGTIKAIGAPRPRQAAAAERQRSPKSDMPADLLQACIDAGGFDQNDRFAA